AIGDLERMISDATRARYDQHDLVFNARHELARWRMVDGDWFTAENELSRLRRDSERRHGDEHLDTLRVDVALAHLNTSTHDPYVASVELQRLADRFTALRGPDDPLTLDVRHKRTTSRGEFQENGAMVPEQERLVEDFTRVFGF